MLVVRLQANRNDDQDPLRRWFDKMLLLNYDRVPSCHILDQMPWWEDGAKCSVKIIILCSCIYAYCRGLPSRTRRGQRTPHSTIWNHNRTPRNSTAGRWVGFQLLEENVKPGPGCRPSTPYHSRTRDLVCFSTRAVLPFRIHHGHIPELNSAFISSAIPWSRL